LANPPEICWICQSSTANKQSTYKLGHLISFTGRFALIHLAFILGKTDKILHKFLMSLRGAAQRRRGNLEIVLTFL
jgi:hypothetical protein